MNLKRMYKKTAPIVLCTLLFAGGGFLYYKFVGCNSNTCAIWSSPMLSISFGAVFGALIGMNFTKKEK